MKRSHKQQGMAFIMIMVVSVLFTAMIIAVYAGLRAQGNLSNSAENYRIALAHAEDGLTVAVAELKNNVIDVNNNKSFSYTTNDGWNVTLTYTPPPQGSTTGALQSVAKNDRFNRAVAVNVTLTGGNNGGLAATYNIYSAQQIQINNGTTITSSGSTSSLNLYSQDSIAVNGNVTIKNVDLISHGSVSNVASASDHVTTTSDPSMNIPFPDLNWSSIVSHADYIATVNTDGAVTANGVNYTGMTNYINALANSPSSTGGIIDFQVSGDVSISNTIDCKNKSYSLFFTKQSGFISDYQITFDAVIKNCSPSAPLNLLADGGSFHFLKCDPTYGVIYTNSEVSDDIHVNNTDSFRVAGIIAKGGVHLNNETYTGYPVAGKWDFISNYWTQNVTLSNWHEL